MEPPETVRDGTLRNVPLEPVPPIKSEISREPISPALESVPLALYQEAVAALQDQVKYLRADMVAQQALRDTETGRQLAQRDALHLDALGRFQAQAALERSLWMERVDAAELRAEASDSRAAASDAKLHEVMDRLLQRQQDAAEPWWQRWFGLSRRSNLRGGQ